VHPIPKTSLNDVTSLPVLFLTMLHSGKEKLVAPLTRCLLGYLRSSICAGYITAGSSASMIFVIPLSPPSLNPKLGECNGWPITVCLFSPSAPCPTPKADPEVFRLRFKVGAGGCGCGKVCENSFCKGEL
jgi:hypothetical protein